MCASAASKGHRAEVDERRREKRGPTIYSAPQIRSRTEVERKRSSVAFGSGAALGTPIDNARSAVDLRVCNFATVTCVHAFHPSVSGRAMDNAQFRNLLKDDKSSDAVLKSSSSNNGFKTPSLGSRARASMPMTPRSVADYNPSKDLLRQVSEHTRQTNGEPPKKRFKTVAAPRGTKFGQGYQDRTNLRQGSEDAQTDREKKLKDLEEMWKKEKIDRATFEKLRDQMGIGGDTGSTHLVKGLDFKLLERVRRGEDLNEVATEPNQAEESANLDDELDTVLDKDVTAQQREEARTGHRAARESSEPQVLTRDEILRRLKTSRRADSAAVTREPDLGDRFKKIAATNKPNKKKFVEVVNGRRREMLVITDKQGKTKRKSRWLDPEGAATNTNAAPLGMEVPADIAAKHKAAIDQATIEEGDDDIFQGVGIDYDPLKDIESDSDNEVAREKTEQGHDNNAVDNVETKPRNYFSTTTPDEHPDAKANPLTKDPTLMAALKRAAAIRHSDEDNNIDHANGNTAENKEQESASSAKHTAFLQKLKQREREDAADMDFGFGESRFGDDDDEDGPLDEYEGEGVGEGESGKGGGQKQQRKRAPKKRKGDKNNVADVMSVLEGRKKGS